MDELRQYFVHDAAEQAALTNFLNNQVNVRSGLVVGSRWFSSNAARLVKSYLTDTNPDPNTYISILEYETRISPVFGLFTFVIAKHDGIEPQGG